MRLAYTYPFMKPQLPLALLIAGLVAGCRFDAEGIVAFKSASPLEHPKRADDPPDVAPAQPVIPDRTFNVADYGAKGDAGVTVNTEPFRRAIAAVKAAGGGTLVVPAAKEAYFTGAFDLCSNLNLRLEKGATILFSPAFSDYRELGNSNRYRPLVLGRDLHDIELSGQGTLDGNGTAWWPEAWRYKAVARAEHARGDTSPRPIMVSLVHCQRVRVEGITFTDSPVFNLVPSNCDDVTVEGITISNPGTSPNTDGIDPKGDRRVLIAHCNISTGDDCVALGGNDPESDILITDCTFGFGHGCSIGSGTTGGLRNLVVRRCSFDGTDTGVRLKSGRSRGGKVENVVYEDLTMKNVGVAISISSYYNNTPIDSASQDAAQPVNATTPFWSNIVIRDVVATACRKNAGLIFGLPEAPVKAVTLEDVSIEAPVGLKIANAQRITLRRVKITAASGPDLIVDPSASGIVRTP